MKKKIYLFSRIVILFTICFFTFTSVAEASDGEDYITIKVQASDENEGLKYAIDSDDPAAFSTQNEFTIPAGTSHTIYVKDAAGNITSQTYHPGNSNNLTTNNPAEVPDDTQQINIDLELGNGKKEEDYSNYEYLTDEPVGNGTGTVTSKVKTDGSDSAEKVFYTVTADSGEVFYMVIDQSQSTDNVYFLNAVTLNDLKSLAEDNNSSGNDSEEKEDNLLDALKNANSEENTLDVVTSKKGGKASIINNNLIFSLVLIALGGVYYYLKVYKNKKNEMMDTMEAMDLEEFEAEEEDGEEVEFDETDDEEKEEYLKQLVEEEEEPVEEEKEEAKYYNMNPDTYAQSTQADISEPSEEAFENAFQFADEEEEEE